MMENCENEALEDTQFCKEHHKQICQWVKESKEEDLSTEPRILIWFDIHGDKLWRTNIPQNLETHHRYTVHYSKKNTQIKIIKHIKGHLVDEYEDEFRCTAPRNKNDVIYLSCNGIKANIYSI